MSGSSMKKVYFILLLALAAVSCHQPEYVAPTANRQGLTSLSAEITEGEYAEQEVARLVVTDPEASRFEIPIPYFYPEVTNNETLIYMLKMRVKAELQPNWKINPRLGVLDLTEEHEFTLTDPSGNSRTITIAASRVKSSSSKLLAFMIEDFKTSCVVYDESSKLLIPNLGDLSSVSVSAQVSPHSKLTKINGEAYSADKKYNMNTGATITLLAHDGVTERTYSVEQGIPQLLSSGMREESVAQLFNVDPVTMVGLPNYKDEGYISLAGLGNDIIVGLGMGRTPFYLDAFSGAKKGTIALGSAVADCLTNDNAGHMVLANFALGGDTAQDVNIYVTSSVSEVPTLLYTFTNPIPTPIGHRIKIMGDVTSDACIVFTSEGVVDTTLSSEIVYLLVRGGVVTEVKTKSFAGFGLAWGSAPVNFATVVPCSEDPDKDGWFLDYYEANVDPGVASETADQYILHYIDGKDKDHWVDLMGYWGVNPNSLDLKIFNGTPYLVLWAVSHFPVWDIRPRMRLYDASDPAELRRLLYKNDFETYEKGGRNEPTGASGDVVLVPSSDGYRMYLYYYDHHAQAIGAYVADCFEI